jgi:hypothetical protein
MAEIKSTLDIIMEKTKGLSLSAEEKEALKREEKAKKIRGWLARFLDDQVTFEDVRRELQKDLTDAPARNLLLSELVAHLHPEGDNGKVFRLMREILKVRTEPVEEKIDAFLRGLIAERVQRLKHLEETLGRSGVSGPAVLPNIARDPGWESYYKKALTEFRAQVLNLTGN